MKVNMNNPLRNYIINHLSMILKKPVRDVTYIEGEEKLIIRFKKKKGSRISWHDLIFQSIVRRERQK